MGWFYDDDDDYYEECRREDEERRRREEEQWGPSQSSPEEWRHFGNHYEAYNNLTGGWNETQDKENGY